MLRGSGFNLGTALQVVRNSSEAEDVVQTVFLKVWVCPEAFRSGRVESWLTVVAKNTSVDFIRSRRHLSALPQRGWLFGAEDDAEDEAMRVFAEREVRNAVKNLPTTLRTLLLASFWDYLTHKNVATEYALLRGTVKPRIRYNTKRVRTMLEGAA